MNDFRKLDVWKLAVDLANDVHVHTRKFPKEEIYGIVSQMRRCSVSISSNLAEGCSRTSAKDFARFLEISLGSCFELETQLLVSKNILYIDNTNYSLILDKLLRIEKMLIKLKNSLNP